MSKEAKLKTLLDLERYLTRGWRPFEKFTDRLMARVRYEKLLLELKESE